MMSDIAYMEIRLTQLMTEAAVCEEEDRWVDLHQEIDELQEELRWAWHEREEEMESWATT